MSAKSRVNLPFGMMLAAGSEMDVEVRVHYGVCHSDLGMIDNGGA